MDTTVEGANIDTSITAGVEQVAVAIADYGLSVLGGVLILIVGWLAARIVSRALDKRIHRFESLDPTLRHFMVRGVRYIILIVTVLAMLAEFGIQTSSLIAVFGAVGLAIGLALQGTLSNVAAGFMLLLFRPFKIGDFIAAAGHSGTVRSLDLFVTELATPDNVQIIVPNAQIWGAAVVNYSFHDTRRADFVLGIDYGDDMDEAIRLVEQVIAADSRCMADPAPVVVVGELADNSVNLTIRVWCAAADYWDVKFDLTKAFKEAMDRAGISIPYPQRTVHLLQPAAPAT